MPKHAIEHSMFQNFRNVNKPNEYVKLFNEHSEDREFRNYRGMDKFIDIEYHKLEMKEQSKFLKTMSIAFTDLFTDSFAIDNL